MGSWFFMPWPLWAKLSFVVVIIAGSIKLWFTNRKVKKYAAVHAPAQARTPEMLEAQHQEPEVKVPFGIRAIESGIEVDGVWISKTNTPAPSSRASRASSTLSLSTTNQLESGYSSVQDKRSRASSMAPSSVFDRAVSAERITTNNGSRASSPGPSRYVVSPYHRLSHVAETGQLTPRVRRPNFSTDLASIMTTATEPAPQATKARPTNSPPAESPAASPSGSDCPQTPTVSLVSTGLLTHDAHPANEARQAIPLLETYQPSTTAEESSRDEEEQMTPNVPPAAFMPPSTRDSQVLRKVNSGFEILKPGTLKVDLPPMDADERGSSSGKKLRKKNKQGSHHRRGGVDGYGNGGGSGKSDAPSLSSDGAPPSIKEEG
ncbi:hypothetical protein BDY21DRAFT_279419 [Lineolata rhizophorae]|uniref:Uncharacterized protein n=1 Tax=Lineolata rhizophorae TaxID=578093 RepID=A0A6A6PAG0_9PEZI|nr:hypothetical protein BDY21DRAFT_279419 [Lineolata rhizophorae]